MIVHTDVLQNTPEWHFLRAGIPTASQFDKIITKGGKLSSQQEGYKFRLLAERISPILVEQGKFTWAMERGSALEKKALGYYQFQTDNETAPVGFVTDDNSRWGASPDQFVGKRGTLEVKCPELDKHMMYLMHEGSAYEEYKIQAQGQLWICERDFVDFLSYHPDLPWSLVRIERDEEFIKKQSAAVEQFSNELEALAAEAKERGWFRIDSKEQEPAKTTTQIMREVLRESIQMQKGEQ